MDVITEFYKLAKEYCQFISDTEISIQSAPALMELLMKLYMDAQKLPERDPETEGSSSLMTNTQLNVHISSEISPHYWLVYDPTSKEEPVCGDLTDDLSDIAKDLMDGIIEYDAGNIGNAIFEWKLGLDYHWGIHLLDAVRYLHWIKKE